jgi:CO/xanthine dehydrogenase FAD-binding subunit
MSFLVVPQSIDEAVEFLAAHESARPISGGATLVAMKNAGLVEASHFVSLERIAALHGISVRTDGGIHIGGMTRHRDTAASGVLTGSLNVVRRAASMIANRPVRNMGTIGGAVANADPAADYLPALVCVGAHVEIHGPAGARSVAISDFIIDWYETVLEAGEIVTGIALPAPRAQPSVYRKLARVSGDFATASCAMALDENEQGGTINVAIGACGPMPVRDAAAEEALRGRLDDPKALAHFGEQLVALADPVDDVRGSAAYRLRLIPRLIALTLRDLQQEKGRTHA